MNMHSLADSRQNIGYLESSGANLARSLKRLSSGVKVDGASDAGGLAVSSKLDSVITRSRTLGANVQNGVSFLESQDAAQSRLGAILTRMSELRVRYDDPTTNTSDGANLNREFKELQEDVRGLAQKKFNGISLFSSGSDADSKLVIGANSVNPSNVRGITRNQFFKSLLETQSSGGPVGGSATRQVNFGSFTDRPITPTGGTASVPGNKVNGLQGTAPVQVINGVTGTTPPQTVNGVATGTTTDLTINAQQGTFSTTVNGAQGTTPDFTLSGTAASGVGTTMDVPTTGGGGSTPSAVWTKNFTGGTNSFQDMSPVFDSNGHIFIGLDEDNKILQLDSNGNTIQTYDLRDPLTGTPPTNVKNMSGKVALADTSGDGSTDTLYAASGDGKQLIAFDTVGTNAGKAKAGWPQTLGGGNTWEITESPPFVDSNGNVYVMSNGGTVGFPFPPAGKLHGFRQDGSSLPGSVFNFPLDTNGQFIGGIVEGPESTLGANDGALILTGYGAHGLSHSVRAMDPSTGNEKWSVDHGTGGGRFGAVKGPPVILGNSVVVNTDRVSGPAWNRKNGSVVAIDLTTQAQTTLYNSTGVMDGGPAVGKSEGTGHATATDAVFVTTSRGVVAMKTDGTGTLWTYTSTGSEDFRTCTPAYDSTNNLVWVTADDAGDTIAFRTVAEGGNAAGTEKHRINPGVPHLGAGVAVGGTATGGSSGSKSSPAIDSSGNLYVGYNNGDLTRISASGSPITLTDVDVGSGYTVATAPLPTDITLTEKPGSVGAIGTLAVDTVTVNLDTSLKITFKGAATASGATYEVTVPSSTITAPADVIRGSNYLSTDTPATRVLAQGIGDKSATLKNRLVALIDGNTAPPTGAGTITDSSGAGNNGNVAAGQVPTHETTDRKTLTAGLSGAYVFDGANDKINLGNLDTQIGQNAAAGPKNELTISAWVYHDASGDDRIVCKSSDTNVANHIFSLGISTGDNVRMRVGTNTTPATSMDGGNIPLNEWTHIAMTYDGANVKSYVNGSLDSTHALTGNILSNTSEGVYIGNVNDTDNRHFQGKLDDVGIWNQALDASEIAEIAGPGDLTVTTSFNDGTDLNPLKVAGSLTIASTGTLATTGPFTIEVDDGVMRNPADFTTGIATTSQLYDAPGDTVGSKLNVSFSGTDANDLDAEATVRSDGQLDIKFTSGAPSGTGNLTMTVDPGTFHLDDPAPQGSGYVSGETPAFTITGAHRGTTGLTGTATVNDGISGGPPPPAAGTLKVDLSAVQPTGTGNLTLKIANGFKAPADLTGIGSGYDFGPPAETPTVTVTGADRGTLITGTATVQSDGKLNVTFPTNQFPTGSGDLTVTIADGVVQNPVSIPIIGTGYDATETPAFTITDANSTDSTLPGATITGNATNNGDGTLSINLSGILPTGTGDLNLTVDSGVVQAPADLTGIGNGYTPGDTPPTVTLTDLSGTLIPPTFSASATINDGILGGPPPPAAGSLNITFAGNPPNTNDITIQIDDGVGHLANQAGGSGYAATDNPAFTISGGGTNMTGFSTHDGSGGLNVDLSNARPDDFTARTLQIDPGTTLQTPTDVTGIGAFHDPSGPPPTVNLSGVGGLVPTVTVQPDGKVNVSFAGTPTNAGPLTVTVAGGSGTGGSAVSSKYLLDIDGDLWDYSVAEFESFTELVSDARAQNGAEQNSLGTFWDLLSTNVNKLEQAAGRIKDADFAKEMTELTKSQIINRSAAVMHGKQNRITSEALLTLQNLNNML